MGFPVVNGTAVMLPPPEGWVVDFTHPSRNEATKSSFMLAFGIEFPIATLFLLQRFYTSAVVLQRFLVDDYLIILAWLFLGAGQAIMLHLWTLGFVGLHAWEQPLEHSLYMTKVFSTKKILFHSLTDINSQLIHALTLLAILGTVLAKITLCVFYYRLSPARWYRYGIIFTGSLCIACYASVFCAVMFACRPVAAAWDLRLFTGDNCIERPPWYMVQAIAGGVTDLLLMVQPIQTVLGLKMSAKHKAALIAWFGIGIITLSAAIMRLISLLSMIHSSDTPWTMAEAMLWLVVESNLIIMCGSLPTFRVWLKHVTTRKEDTTKKSGSSPSDNSNGNRNGNRSGHALRTFGARSTRNFDTIAEIEYGDHFHPDDHSREGGAGAKHTQFTDSGSEEVMLRNEDT